MRTPSRPGARNAPQMGADRGGRERKLLDDGVDRVRSEPPADRPTKGGLVTRPGIKCTIRIEWTAFTTLAPGLVAHAAPSTDRAFGPWVLTHAPSGRVVSWCDGPEHAQAIAAQLTDVDWLNLDMDDKRAMDAVRTLSREILRRLGGRRVDASPRLPLWEDLSSE